MWPWEMMNELNATMQAQMADANRQKTRAKEAAKRALQKNPRPSARPQKEIRSRGRKPQASKLTSHLGGINHVLGEPWATAIE